MRRGKAGDCFSFEGDEGGDSDRMYGEFVIPPYALDHSLWSGRHDILNRIHNGSPETNFEEQEQEQEQKSLRNDGSKSGNEDIRRRGIAQMKMADRATQVG